MMRIDRRVDGERVADVHRMITDLCSGSGCGDWWPTDAADVMAFIHQCRDTGYCAVIVDEDTEDTAGCLLGFIGPCPFSHSVMVARETILWVDDRSRGQGCGEKLASDFLSWAKDAGASLVSVGSTYGFGEKHIKKIADALGFVTQETMYLRRA